MTGLAKYFEPKILGYPHYILFRIAALRGNVAAGRELVAIGGFNINQPVSDQYNQTAFISACQNGRVDFVEFLLSLPGIDVNAVMQNGESGLWMARQSGHEGVVEVLLTDPRLNADLARADGMSPCYIAAQNGYQAILRLLL